MPPARQFVEPPNDKTEFLPKYFIKLYEAKTPPAIELTEVQNLTEVRFFECAAVPSDFTQSNRARKEIPRPTDEGYFECA